MQDERSQIQNRARAMTVLRSRLLQAAQEEADAKMSAVRRSQVGAGGRGEKIRTYNFKENRLTDHRIGFTIYRLADVLAGDLDEVVDALNDERARQLANLDA
jgi:peptide chain release factor 1